MTKKPKVWSAERSQKQLFSDAKTNAKAFNSIWSLARKAPLFLRKAKYEGHGKNKRRALMKNRFGVEVPVPQRGNRCLRSATFKALLSGAAASAAEILGEEGADLKQDLNGEAKVASYLPKMTASAEILLEHALSMYASTIFKTAVSLKDDLKIHTKVSHNGMLAAADIVNRDIFSSVSFKPSTYQVETKVPKKRAKKQPLAADGEAPEPMVEA